MNKNFNFTMLVLAGLLTIQANATPTDNKHQNEFAPKYEANHIYRVVNPIIDNKGYSFDNIKMEKFYRQTEKTKNFIKNSVSLGYVDLHKEVSSGLYPKHSYLYFVVDENRKVHIAPVVITGNNKAPQMTITTLGKDTGAICSTEKETVYWTGFLSSDKSNWQENRPSTGLECLTFTKPTNANESGWQPPMAWQDIYHR